MRAAALMAAVLVAGAGFSPAPVSARPHDRNGDNITCPPIPPNANRSRSIDGGVALQLPGIGVTGKGARVIAESDVIIQSAGHEAYLNDYLFSVGCDAIVDENYGNKRVQFEALIKLRQRLRREAATEPAHQAGEPVAAAPAVPTSSGADAFVIDLTPAPLPKSNAAASVAAPASSPNAALQKAIEGGTIGASENPPASHSPTPPAPPPTQPISDPQIARPGVMIDLSNPARCSTMSGGNLMQTCMTGSGNATFTCTQVPQVQFSPGISVGGRFIAGTLTTWQTNCTSSAGWAN